MHRILAVVFLSLAMFCISFAQQTYDPVDGFRKTADDDDRQFTSVGNIGLTITNFGTIGTRNSSWPRQPSCEYPRGSRIEHIYQGGLWVGALVKTQNPSDPRNNQYLVSTGSSDQYRKSLGLIDGYEYNAE